MCPVEYWQVFCLGMLTGAIVGVLFCLATVKSVDGE